MFCATVVVSELIHTNATNSDKLMTQQTDSEQLKLMKFSYV